MADSLHHEQAEHTVHLEERLLKTSQALRAATLSDNHEGIGKLIKMGARNIDECIQLAKERDLVKAKAILSLVKVAMTGGKALLGNSEAHLPGLNLESVNISGLLADEEIAKVVLSGEVSTHIPLELAQQSGQRSIYRELLMLAQINKQKGHVDWSKLNLVGLDLQLLGYMKEWLREFKLSSNILKSVPAELKMLKEVRL